MKVLLVLIPLFLVGCGDTAPAGKDSMAADLERAQKEGAGKPAPKREPRSSRKAPTEEAKGGP